MFTTYIIQSIKTKKYYIGSTSNIEKRLIHHNEGLTRSTKNKGPYKIIYMEEYNIRGEALKREKTIKRYKGGQAFKKLLQKCWDGGVDNRISL